MKKLSASLLFLLAVLSCGAYETEYATAPIAGEMYFIRHIDVTNTSLVVTNLESYPWYPAKIRITQPAHSTNTFTMDVVRSFVTNQYVGNVVSTNPFGTVETNWNATITNEVSIFITNRIASTAMVNQAEGVVYCPYDYIQRDDKIMYSFTLDSETKWIEIIGWR